MTKENEEKKKEKSEEISVKMGKIEWKSQETGTFLFLKLGSED